MHSKGDNAEDHDGQSYSQPHRMNPSLPNQQVNEKAEGGQPEVVFSNNRAFVCPEKTISHKCFGDGALQNIEIGDNQGYYRG